MIDIQLRLRGELRRMSSGPYSGEMSLGIGIIRFLVRCPLGTKDVVLAKAKAVLETLDEAALEGWPVMNMSAPHLPEWFTSACAAEMSAEQAEEWLVSWKRLSPEARIRAEIEKDWSLDNWLYWMEPSNRQWFWWDAQALEDYDHIGLAIEVEAWPFPWGALRWLFRASGASAVLAEE